MNGVELGRDFLPERLSCDPAVTLPPLAVHEPVVSGQSSTSAGRDQHYVPHDVPRAVDACLVSVEHRDWCTQYLKIYHGLYIYGTRKERHQLMRRERWSIKGLTRTVDVLPLEVGLESAADSQ